MPLNYITPNDEFLKGILRKIEKHHSKVEFLERHEITDILLKMESKIFRGRHEHSLSKKCRIGLLRIQKSVDEFKCSVDTESSHTNTMLFASVRKQGEIREIASTSLNSSQMNSTDIPLSMLTNDDFVTQSSQEQCTSSTFCSKSTQEFDKNSAVIGGFCRYIDDNHFKRPSNMIQLGVPPRKRRSFEKTDMELLGVNPNSLDMFASNDTQSEPKLNIIDQRIFSMDDECIMPIHITPVETTQIMDSRPQSGNQITHRITNLTPKVHQTGLQSIIQREVHEINMGGTYSFNLCDSSSAIFNPKVIDDSLPVGKNNTSTSQNVESYSIEDMPIIFAKDCEEVQDNDDTSPTASFVFPIDPNAITSKIYSDKSNSRRSKNSNNINAHKKKNDDKASGNSASAKQPSPGQSGAQYENKHWKSFEMSQKVSEETLKSMMEHCIRDIKSFTTYLEENIAKAGTKSMNTKDVQRIMTTNSLCGQKLDFDKELHVITKLLESQVLDRQKNFHLNCATKENDSSSDLNQ